jgi:Protein of unknown function (DUF3048) N-terminal domain/Protein of unknown function (DUF3048) C-terminal domain
MRRAPAAILVIIALAAGAGFGIFAGRAVLGPAAQPSGVAQVGQSASASASPTELGGSPSDSGLAPSDSASPEPTATPVPTPVLVPDPLDGVLVSPAVAKRHVVAVMIDDQQDARPQSGLSAASQVWQAPAEGGIPRYVALFSEGTPPAVGPIRSSRLYFISWAAEWNAVYMHVGGSPQALALLRTAQGSGKAVWNADEIRLGDTYMWRIKTRSAPHNMYSNSKSMRLLVKAVHAPVSMNYTAHWQFAPDAPVEQRPTSGSIRVPYDANVITYAYQPSTNAYLRSVTAEGKQVDAGTKQRIAPKNVVVIFMSFAPLNDGTNHGRLEAQFTGTGKAWVFTNGTLVKGTWKKKSLTAPTLLLGPDGKPITLTVGQTFVQVIQIGKNVTYKLGKVPAPPASPSPSDQPSPSPSPVGMIEDRRPVF